MPEVSVMVVATPFTTDVAVPVATPPPLVLVVTDTPDELAVAVTNEEDELELDDELEEDELDEDELNEEPLTVGWVTPENQLSKLNPT